MGRAVCAPGSGPSALRECRDALRAEQPASVVCGASPAAGLLLAGTDAGADTRFVSRPGFAGARSRSPAVQPGSCLGAQTPARARDRDSGAELCCRAAPMSHPGPASRSLLQHPKGSIWAAGSSRISKAAQEISRCLFLVTQLLCLCPSFGQALGCERSSQSECWWVFWDDSPLTPPSCFQFAVVFLKDLQPSTFGDSFSVDRASQR